MLGEVWLDCSAKRLALRTGWNQWASNQQRMPELVLSHSITHCAHLGKCITKQLYNICLSHEQWSGLHVCVCVYIVVCFWCRQTPCHEIIIGMYNYTCIFSWSFHSSVTCCHPLCLDVSSFLRYSCDIHFLYSFNDLSNPWPHSGPYMDCFSKLAAVAKRLQWYFYIKWKPFFPHIFSIYLRRHLNLLSI